MYINMRHNIRLEMDRLIDFRTVLWVNKKNNIDQLWSTHAKLCAFIWVALKVFLSIAVYNKVIAIWYRVILFKAFCILKTPSIMALPIWTTFLYKNSEVTPKIINKKFLLYWRTDVSRLHKIKIFFFSEFLNYRRKSN